MNFGQIFTKDNIALTLSVISIGITVWNFIIERNKEKVNLTVEVHDSWGAGDSRNIVLDIAIINNSHLPITINRIELGMMYSNGELITRCYGKDERFITESTNGKVQNVINYEQLPLDIPSLGSQRGWFQFNSVKVPVTRELNNLKCRLIIYCKGKAISIPVLIPKSKLGE